MCRVNRLELVMKKWILFFLWKCLFRNFLCSLVWLGLFGVIEVMFMFLKLCWVIRWLMLL